MMKKITLTFISVFLFFNLKAQDIQETLFLLKQNKFNHDRVKTAIFSMSNNIQIQSHFS